MASTEINLLKKSTASFGVTPELEEKVRLAAWWGLVGLLASGIIIGTIFLVLSSRVRNLETTNAQLAQQINAQSVKEGILLSLVQRTKVAGNALKAARPWGNLFPLLEVIAHDSNYRTLVIDEAGKVRLNFHIDNIDTAAEIVEHIIDLNSQGSLKAPQLLSFVVEEDGTVNMGVLFVPTL